MLNLLGSVLFLFSTFSTVAATGEQLRVISVHTAAAPRISMVVQPPDTQPVDESTETCTVTVDGEPVAAAVTPMASGELSAALVIDTTSDLTAQEMGAVRSAAADFLLRLPDGARSMVVAAGGEPQIVAPLSAHPAEALSAISGLQAGGLSATTAGTRLAAQSLESAPPGPRAIIVYSHGGDEQGPSVDQLSEAVVQANAVVYVISTAESIWPSVVDRTGGLVLPPTGAADITQSYGRLATMLSEQYVVTFQAPGELPAVAEVTFQSGGQEYRTVVNLPGVDSEQAAPPESSRPTEASGTARLLALVLLGIGLAMLGVFVVLRARERQRVGGDESAAMARSMTSGAMPNQTAPKAPPADQTPPRQPTPPPTAPRPTRSSLSAAVQGRQLARLNLNSAPEPVDQYWHGERIDPATRRRPNGASAQPAAAGDLSPGVQGGRRGNMADKAGSTSIVREVHMVRPETPQAAGGAAEEVAKDVAGESPDTGETGTEDAAADAARTGVAPDAMRDETSETPESPWADDRTTHLDPGRVSSDDQQTPADRHQGEPDE